MPFTPRPLPSGNWQGGFRHPLTRRKITRTFPTQAEAEAWAVRAERDSRPGTLAAVYAERDAARDSCIRAVYVGQIERAKAYAADAVRLAELAERLLREEVDAS